MRHYNINQPGRKSLSSITNENPLFNGKLEMLEQFFNLSQDMICVIGMDGYFKKISPRFAEILGYSVEELMSKPYSYYMREKDGKKTTHDGSFPVYFENSYACSNGNNQWFSWQSSKPTSDNLIYLIARDIGKQKKAELEAREYALQLEVYKHETLESLRYAQQLQNKIMPLPESLKLFLPQSFITFMPKQGVSGDFFWFDSVNDKTLLTVGDCTGHGVPGGLLSVVGVSLFHNALHHENLTTVNSLVQKLDTSIDRMLTHKYTGEKLNDGMDLCFCSIDKESLEMEYVAVNNPIYIIRNKTLIQLKYEKYTLGSNKGGNEIISKKFQLEKNDMVYLFSDGYTDQFGGPKSKKFGHPEFRNMLLNISDDGMKEQKDHIEQNIKNWMGYIEQTDDISLMGFRI